MHCKNCKTALPETADYCNTCGGKVIRNRLTLKNLIQHFSAQFFNYDNKLFMTFWILLKDPKAVIVTYINGVRNRFVNPISYFAIALTISGFQLYIIRKFFPDAMDISGYSPNGNPEFMDTLSSGIFEYYSLISMASIPIYALMVRITFFNYKKFNYTELLLTFIYITSQTTIISSIIIIVLLKLGVSYMALSYSLTPFMILYSAYCLKSCYGLSNGKIALKTLLFLLVLMLFYIITVILIIIIAAMSYGGFEEFFNATQQMQQ